MAPWPSRRALPAPRVAADTSCRLLTALRASGARGLKTTPGGRVNLNWPHCDGLIWPHAAPVGVDGREYAQIGDRLYTRHAVDRLQPGGLGTPAGASVPGRSISPNFVEDVLSSSRGVPAKGPNGEARLSFVSGSVQVITENGTVVTVITR